MKFSPTSVITIVGRRGTGKTTLSRRLHGSKIWPRVVVFDRLGEYDETEFTGVASSFDSFATLLRRYADLSHFRLLFRFDIESDNKDAEFNEALRVLYYLGGVCIVIEETWNFSSPHFLPKWYREILLTGRHGQNKLANGGIALITTSQRPAEVHKTIYSQSDFIYCGQTHESNDKKYLSEFIGRENSDKLSDLNKGYFLQYSPGHEVKIINNRT